MPSAHNIAVRLRDREGAIGALRDAAHEVLRAVEIGGDVEALVGAVVRRAVDRGLRVDEARALLQHAVGEGAVGVHRGLAARDDAALHLVGREAGLLLSTSAATPETTAADCEVPDIVKKSPLFMKVGWSTAIF